MFRDDGDRAYVLSVLASYEQAVCNSTHGTYEQWVARIETARAIWAAFLPTPPTKARG